MHSFDFLADLHCRRAEAAVEAVRVVRPLHEARLFRVVGFGCGGASNLSDRLAGRVSESALLDLEAELLRLVGLFSSFKCFSTTK